MAERRPPKYIVPKKAPLKKSPVRKEPVRKEHYVADFGNRGATEYEIETQVDELFRATPIPFKFENQAPPQVNTQFGTVNQLDANIAQTIYDCNITIPITNINDKQYLIGPEKKNCLMKNDTAYVMIGGGVERFDEFVPRNQRKYQKKLVQHMIHNNQSLEWVTDQLAAGKNITGTKPNAPYPGSPTNRGAQKFKSPTRSPTRQPGTSPSRP